MRRDDGLGFSNTPAGVLLTPVFLVLVLLALFVLTIVSAALRAFDVLRSRRR